MPSLIFSNFFNLNEIFNLFPMCACVCVRVYSKILHNLFGSVFFIRMQVISFLRDFPYRVFCYLSFMYTFHISISSSIYDIAFRDTCII